MIDRTRFILELDVLWKLNALMPQIIKVATDEAEMVTPSAHSLAMILNVLHNTICEMKDISDVLHRAIGETPPAARAKSSAR
jgi:hypothetical protein